MKSFKLTNEAIVSMKVSLDRIDNANNRQAGIDKPFQFPAKGIYWIGRLMGKVKSAFDDIEATRVKMVERYMERQKAAGIKNEQQLEGEFLADFSREYQKDVMAMVIDVELPEMKLSFFDLDKNPHFPLSVIRDLEVLIVDDSPADEKKDAK